MKHPVLTILSLTAFVLSASAQSEMKVNKVLRLQQFGNKSVLTSTDSRLPQAVVEFDHATDMTDMPQEVLDFLSSYEEASRRIEAGADPASVLSIDRSPSAALEDSVGPLLGDIAFDQGTPYNDRCPVINNARAITGCVATAMSELMAFWQYPSVGTGTATYTGSNGAQTFNFADHPFDWDNILPTYTAGHYTSAQAGAIAELMLAAGASVNMNYNSNGSGANSERVLPALRDVFGYSPSMEFLHDASDDIIATVWVACLKKEFNEGRPVYYSGATQTSGHAFVIDGYKTSNGNVLFHVNWGWNGSYNGWYLITSLRPQNENYSSYRNDFVFNIRPKGEGIDHIASSETRIDMNAPVYTILGNKIPANSMQRGMIYIQNGRKFVW